MKANAMVINHETAMSLWSKRYGKASKVKDFAGREIIKAAYDNRNSKYGWNVDHILPQSKGGKTNDSNLVCCHILTNDEKANKFPCFSANYKQFEILKVENHYEIKQKSVNQTPTVNTNEESINFFDSADGIRFFRQLECTQNKEIFIGTVVINLYGMTTTAILDFIKEIFIDKNITYETRNDFFYRDSFTVVVKDYDMPQKEDISDLLNKCILLNTYLGNYFKPYEIINGYQIFYGVHTSENKSKALYSDNTICGGNSFSLLINELVKINTDANEKSDLKRITNDKLGYDVYGYDYIYTKLADNLKKLK